MEAQGRLVAPQPVLLVSLLPVDARHEGAGEDEGDDGDQADHHAAPDVYEQQGRDVPPQPLLHDGEAAVDVDPLVGADVGEDAVVVLAAAVALHEAAGVGHAVRAAGQLVPAVAELVPVLVSGLEVEGAAALEVPLEGVPLVAHVLVHPVAAHLVQDLVAHLQNNNLSYGTNNNLIKIPKIIDPMKSVQ